MSAGEARDAVKRAPRTPNTVLRAIRESERRESRDEFVEAMTRIAREIGAEVYPDSKYVQRLESGEITWPHRTYRNILEKLCGLPAHELGFAPSARPGDGSSRANVALQEAIWESGIELAEFARKIGVDPKTAERWITRGVIPQPFRRWKASLILGIDESELWPDATTERKEKPARAQGAAKSGKSEGKWKFAGDAAQDADRRAQEGRVIEALDVIGNDQISGIADGIGDLVDHYAHAVCALPPAEVYNEILSVRSYAGGIVDRPGNEKQRGDLVAATGWLSNLLAVAACDMGEHAAARVWSSDAERRSREARHPEIAAWAVLTRAMIAFYQGQPLHSAMLAKQGQGIAPIGTVIHAKLAAHEMRAAAMVGNASRVAEARRYAATAISALSADAKVTGAFSINLAEDPPYTATSLLFVGEFDEAVSSTNRVIEHVYHPETRQRGENPSGYARSLLILGLAQAGAGRIDEAAAVGKEALSGSRPAWTTMVLAGKLDQILTRDYADASDTAEYHHAYFEAASRPAVHHLQIPAPPRGRQK
jgi:hypothetical protein